jgi:hypothetical protein
MDPLTEPQEVKSPGIMFTSMVLLAVLVLYPLAGGGLTLLATGGRLVDPDFRMFGTSILPRLRAAQAAGQVIALALPALLLAWRFSGSRTLFGKANLSWLGLGRPAGFVPLLKASAGILLLQPLMYSITEVQNLGLPLLGEAGRAMLHDQERLDLIIRKLTAFDSMPGFLEVALVIVATPALCEELFFRGFVQKGFSSSLPPVKAIFLSGFVFALFHMQPSNVLPLTLLGWYIGYIYLKTGNLAVPAAAHGTNNLAALLFLQAELRFSGLSLTEGGPGIVTMWQWWVFVLVSLVIFFVLMRRFHVPTASAQFDNNA